MCEVLEVSRSGFYAWRKRSESERSKRHRELVVEMKTIHGDRDMRSYGSPRMGKELIARGHQVSENTVAKLMRDHGMRSASSRKFRVTTDSNHSLPVAKNVLDREFQQELPDRVWLADITYIWTREGWLYLACVLDTYSRRIVGWSMGERIAKDLVLGALRMALGRRRPGRAGSLLHHSDRGSQYASHAFQELLRDEKITCSMSRKGNCWEATEARRAVRRRYAEDGSRILMESFFATLKKERVHLEEYATRAEARASVFDYIERFYNRVRRHSALGYLSPDQFEQVA